MRKQNNRWQLVFYDLLAFLFIDIALFLLYRRHNNVSWPGVAMQMGLTLLCVYSARFCFRVYRQIWRYGGIQCYLRLLMADACGFAANTLLEQYLPIEHITFVHLLSMACINVLFVLMMRMLYRYAFKYGTSETFRGRVMNRLLRIFAGRALDRDSKEEPEKINIAIIGAGRVGISLAEELLASHTGNYNPKYFVDTNKDKINRIIHGIPVLFEDSTVFDRLREAGVKEVVFAIHEMEDNVRKKLYQRYLDAGYKLKVYDYPMMQTAGGRRHLREFDIEELLLRKPVEMQNEKVNAYYRDKVVLITGGGGSIGSEICRQLAKMAPKQIILLDIYENGAYDVQQELRIAYGGALDVQVEIASITNRRAMTRAFQTYRPQIVINAAAHKHVPLMENNCIEAVENNVFGTVVLIELCEQFGAERFMMVSTDKAVNPTNVMGATKRMCEMIVQCASTQGKVKYSATRFGNVLGSAGSVIPLFKRQIANGGPITLTDKRIVRYFMTIPEASQLVLQSGAMANNGELFVLDMGQPVRILDLAKNMIRLAGVPGVQIVETGLRPGEKLYEELLVKTDELEKTENSLIFIERDVACSQEEIAQKLHLLQDACTTEDDDAVRRALHQAVPTFKTPEEINAEPAVVGR